MADTHHEKHSASFDLDGRTEIENASYRGNSKDAAHENMNSNQLRANAKIANPLAGYSHNELAVKGEEYMKKH